MNDNECVSNFNNWSLKTNYIETVLQKDINKNCKRTDKLTVICNKIKSDSDSHFLINKMNCEEISYLLYTAYWFF